MAMKQGTIIDATLISAPSSTKNKIGKRGPEMHQPKKGNQWYSGMKDHNRSAEGKGYGVDKHSGLIYSVEITSANLYDMISTSQLLQRDEEVVYGDAGYQGIDKRVEIADQSFTFRVTMRPGKRRALPDTPDGSLLDLAETAMAHNRTKVEHQLGVIKQQFVFQKIQR